MNKVDINPTISIIIWNVNGPNAPIKKIFTVDQKTQCNYMLSTRSSPYININICSLKICGWKK